MMRDELQQQQRRTLKTFANTLIPASPDGPSADEAHVAEIWVDMVLAERPDLVPGLLRILDAYDGSEPRAYLEQLQRKAKDEFDQLTYVIAGSFFASPEAKEWLGVTRLRDEYEGAEAEPAQATDALLRPVRAMKPFYRPTSLKDAAGPSGVQRGHQHYRP